MGLFDKFTKKNAPHYDSTNIRVHDLDVGFVFDYNLSTWEVQAIYEYDWGDSFFTREFKIYNGEKTLFLSIEDDDELEISVFKKIKVRKLGEAVLNKLISVQKPPDKIDFDGREYFLGKESPGYFHDLTKKESDWIEFISWEFEDDTEEFLIIIEQWDEKEFEASAGKYIKEFEISNILPREDKK